MLNSRALCISGIPFLVLFVSAPVDEVYSQETPAPVVVTPVVERVVATGQTFVGTVVPLKTSIVGSAVDGRVVEFLVDEGDAVKKDQPLARLRTDTLKIELAGAQAELTLRKEELAELENGSRPEEKAQAKAKLAASEASRDYSLMKYERMQTLFRENSAVTEDELQEARAIAARDEQFYLEAKALNDLAVNGPRKERISQAKARMLVQAEQVHLIEDRIKKHTLVAPFDGYVTAEHTEVGEWVSQGDPIADVVLLGSVDIRVFVLAEHASHLQIGTTARLEIPALPEEVFTGEVALLVPQADVRSRTFPVKIRVQNREGKAGPLLKAGMLARAFLPTGEKKQSPLVPKDALVLGGEKPLVFVVDRESKDSEVGTVRAVPVEPGVAEGMLIQVKGALKEGDLVVVRGNERLRAGQKISIAKTKKSTPSQTGD